MSPKSSPVRPTTWPLLTVPDEHGQLSFASPEDSVRQMIRIILSTRPGEQLMHPEFGAGIDRFLHEPNTVDTRRQLRELVATAIIQWEPRVVLDRVDVDELPQRPDRVRVEIVYRIRRTGVVQKLGLSLDVGA